MGNTINYENLIAFHPGSYVEDIIENYNITQEEFSVRVDETSKVISQLVNGEIRLQPKLAFKLENVTGISYETWMNLQNQYDKKIIEIENEKNFQKEVAVANQIDFNYFKNNEFVETRRYGIKEKIEELRKILHLESLTMLTQFNPSVSYRNAKEFNINSIVNSNVMLEIAINTMADFTDKKLDKAKLRKSLPLIKELVLEKPNVFYDKLKEILLESGVVFLCLPHLKNSNLHGATKKFKNGSVLLLMTDRYKSADIFWFSLLHEISHIIDNDFYTDKDDIRAYQEKEERANDFAENFFIPTVDYLDFVNAGDFSEKAIKNFAESNQVKPFMLTGRLRKDQYIGYTELTKFDEQYEIKLSI